MKQEIIGENQIMKKMLSFCVLAIVVLLCTACPVVYGGDDWNFNEPVIVSGRDKIITKEASSAGGVYRINFDRLIFANTNVTINIIPIEASELARVDVTYSENLDNYDFDITIANEIISIGADSAYAYDIDKFEMTIYAVFNDIYMGGGGYKVLVDVPNVSHLNITSSESVACDVSSLDASNIYITTNGSSSITLSGTVDNAKIETNGSSNIFAEYLICDNATLETNGSSKILISVRTTLIADAEGSSYIGYYGSPPSITTSGYSTVKQISPNFP